jgi:ADP-ribose pyrophosphatase
MRSDTRKKSNSSKGWIVPFLGGCLFTLFLQWMCSAILNRSSRSYRDSCTISLGTYKGTQYTNAEAGTVGRPKCLVESKFIKVQQHSVQLPANGDQSSALIEDWIWIDYHDRINVLIEAESGIIDEPQFLIFEQTKYALEGRKSLAIVGGIIEPGEQPVQAAHREVLEETGQDCATFHFLGRYRTDVNRGMGWTNTYIAADCQKQKIITASNTHATDEVGVADTERRDIRKLSLTEIRKAVQAGQFLEIQWSATVALAMIHYKE